MTPSPAQVLQLVGRDEGISIAKASKKLLLRQSQLRRTLTALGSSVSLGGLDWIEIRSGDPDRLYLTETGRQQLQALA